MSVFYEKGKKYNCYIHGNPRYRITVTIGGVRKNFYGDGEKDARRKVEEAKALAATGVDLNKATAKIGDVFHYWLFNVKRVDKKIKASSFTRYETAYRLHVKPYQIASMKLSKLSSAAFQAYITGLYEEHDVSAAGVQNVAKVWKMFLKWAVDEGYLVKDPSRNLSLPGEYRKSVREVETFTDEERRNLSYYMEESGYEYDTVIRLAFATGMRQGELLGLMWDDIHEDHVSVRRSTAVVTHTDKNGNKTRGREVWETKTLNSVRDIPILPSTYAMLKAHKVAQAEWFLRHGIPKNDFVFTTDSGKLIDPKNFNRSYTRLLTRAGVGHKKFHAIRHTFATEAIRRGVNVKDLQMLMGHADIQTTYVYVHASEESKREAIQLLGDII